MNTKNPERNRGFVNSSVLQEVTDILQFLRTGKKPPHMKNAVEDGCTLSLQKPDGAPGHGNRESEGSIQVFPSSNPGLES